jgi:hypothetical protein
MNATTNASELVRLVSVAAVRFAVAGDGLAVIYRAIGQRWIAIVDEEFALKHTDPRRFQNLDGRR